jgi:hypothetical protein
MCLMVSPRLHATSQESLARFSSDLSMTFTKICKHIPVLVRIIYINIELELYKEMHAFLCVSWA